MRDRGLRLVYLFDTAEGLTELRVLAERVEQRNGWVFAIVRDQVISGVKEEYLKAFYMEVND